MLRFLLLSFCLWLPALAAAAAAFDTAPEMGVSGWQSVADADLADMAPLIDTACAHDWQALPPGVCSGMFCPHSRRHEPAGLHILQTRYRTPQGLHLFKEGIDCRQNRHTLLAAAVFSNNGRLKQLALRRSEDALQHTRAITAGSPADTLRQLLCPPHPHP
ncbi:MAG: hypothetical protein Q4A62_05360 [Eikenella sp.]|nr:hypothetical protein [Eikenella sp.]